MLITLVRPNNSATVLTSLKETFFINIWLLIPALSSAKWYRSA